MGEGGLVHYFRGACRDVARVLTQLLSLSLLHLRINFHRSEDLVAHAVIVESHRKVTFNCDSFHLADEVDPLNEATALQA